MLQSFSRFNTPWSPLSWAGQGLVNLGEGNWLTAAGYLLITLGVGVAIFAIALVAAEKTVLQRLGEGPIQLAEKESSPSNESGKRCAVQAGQPALVPAPIRAMILKDFRVLRRDLRNLSQLMTPLILGVMYGFAILRQGARPPMGAGEAPEWVNYAITTGFGYADIGIAIFVGWILVMALAGRGFSQEGKSYLDAEILPVECGSDAHREIHGSLDPSRSHRLDLPSRLCNPAAAQAAEPAILDDRRGIVLCRGNLHFGSLRSCRRAI